MCAALRSISIGRVGSFAVVVRRRLFSCPGSLLLFFLCILFSKLPCVIISARVAVFSWRGGSVARLGLSVQIDSDVAFIISAAAYGFSARVGAVDGSSSAAGA